MFEDSLVESRIGHSTSSDRWTAAVSIGLQCAIAAFVIALPLLHPERLASRIEAPRVLMPLPPRPPVPPVRVEPTETPSTAPSLPASPMTQTRLLPSPLPGPNPPSDQPPPIAPFGSGLAMATPPPAAVGIGAGHGPGISVAPARQTGPVRISSGISQGMLIAPIRPLYPPIAKAAGVQGTVVVEAIISRTGTIESLRAVSGPPMLQNAALDAIRAARYQPYRLNGEPTEVQTTITVNFRLGG